MEYFLFNITLTGPLRPINYARQNGSAATI